jgi:hypothetical protein
MVTFIATAYQEQLESHTFINSLLLQTDPNWKCIVFADGGNEYIKNFIDNINDPRISYYESHKVKGCWGNANRKHALDWIVNTDFVVPGASIQDYYLPIVVEQINKYKNDYDFIYFNCIHHSKDYDVLDTNPKVGEIDWGSFALKTSLAKETDITDFCNPLTDGMFVERCFNNNPNLKHIKINKYLFVHN